MSKTWVTADHHFGHNNVLKFQDDSGNLIRGGFSNIDEMDEFLVEQWNSTVHDDDRVYHLGDLTFKNSIYEKVMPLLNGRLILVKGNHDGLKLNKYVKYFDDIRSVVPKPNIGIILSHYPLHKSSLTKFVLNVHGHTHQRSVMLDEHTEDMRYYCVSVEQTEYRPVDMEYLIELAKIRKGVLE